MTDNGNINDDIDVGVDNMDDDCLQYDDTFMMTIFIIYIRMMMW